MNEPDLEKVYTEELEKVKKICEKHNIPFSDDIKHDIHKGVERFTARFETYEEYKADREKLMAKLMNMNDDYLKKLP